MKWQSSPDDARVGADVQPVREPEKRIVLLRIAQVEDVFSIDANLADLRVRGLELGEGRKGLRSDRRGAGERECSAGGEGAHHSSTRSARARIDCGIVMPISRAARRFRTSSTCVGCSTGISPGAAPRRILLAWIAALRWTSAVFTP